MFTQFNATHICAASEEQEEGDVRYYYPRSKIPYYGERGKQDTFQAVNTQHHLFE